MGMTGAELGHALFRVLETGDTSLATEVVHPDFSNREAVASPSASSLPGPAGVLASSAWMRAAFSELAFEILDTAEAGDRVWVRLRMRGWHTGPFVRYHEGKPDQVVPPTERWINFEQIHVLDVREGKVVRHEAVRDDITMLGQLGVFPPSGAAALRMLRWKVTKRDVRAALEVSAAADAAAATAEGVSGVE